MKFIALLFLLLPASLSFGRQEQPSNLASLVASAQQATAQNNYAAAASDYMQAVRIRPDIPELWANLGLMQQESGEYSEAIQSLERALRMKPSLYAPTLFLGIDETRAGRAKEAVPMLLKAETMNASDPLAPLSLSRAYKALGETGPEIHALLEAIRRDPRQASAWFDLGIAQLEEVENEARELTNQYPTSSYAKALFAESLVQQSRDTQAAGLYTAILSDQDQPPCMLSESGFLDIRNNRAEDAARAFASERQLHPACPLALLGQAALNIRDGQYAAALALVKQAWQRDAGSFATNLSRLFSATTQKQMGGFLDYAAQQKEQLGSDLYAVLTHPAPEGESISSTAQIDTGSHIAEQEHTGGHRSTLDLARQLYLQGHDRSCANQLRNTLQEDHSEALQLLAACSFFTGDYSLAWEAGERLSALRGSSHPEALYWSIKANEKLAFQSLAQFQQLEPNSARTHILMGDIYRQREQYDDAQREYQKALALSPDSTAALLGLASAYFGNANFTKTIEAAQDALRVSPDDPEINLLMGEALISQHDLPRSEPYLLKALKAKPQMLPHVHALLGEAYAADGRIQDAIRELKLGAGSDEDGSLHYRLARLYMKVGDKTAANAALQQMKTLEQEQRKRAVIALKDSHAPTTNQAP